MLRAKMAELLIHGLQTDGVELGFEAKMADTALEFEHFKLGIGQHSGQEVGGLRGQGSGGRFAHRGILFERLMLFFHFPPSLVNRGQLGLVQVGIAADQIQHSLAPVLVCKDLSGYEYGRLDRPQKDAQGLCSGKDQRLHGLELALGARRFTQGHRTAAFEGKNEVVAQRPHQMHVFGRGVPAVGQQVA